jgi:hypothetical protein
MALFSRQEVDPGSLRRKKKRLSAFGAHGNLAQAGEFNFLMTCKQGPALVSRLNVFSFFEPWRQQRLELIS